VKVRDAQEHDMPLLQAISIVFERHPHLKLDDQVVQWCVSRLKAWFAADANEISLKNWDQERVLTGGHGLMANGYCPVIESLARGLDIKLNQRLWPRRSLSLHECIQFTLQRPQVCLVLPPAITHMTNVATCIIGFAKRRLLLCFSFSLTYTHLCQEASSDMEGWSHCSVPSIPEPTNHAVFTEIFPLAIFSNASYNYENKEA